MTYTTIESTVSEDVKTLLLIMLKKGAYISEPDLHIGSMSLKDDIRDGLLRAGRYHIVCRKKSGLINRFKKNPVFEIIATMTSEYAYPRNAAYYSFEEKQNTIVKMMQDEKQQKMLEGVCR